MVNKERGEFALTLDGKPYTLVLRLTTNACCELEDISGRKVDVIQKGCMAGYFRDMRLILWAALRSRHPEIATTDAAGLQRVGVFMDRMGTQEDLVEKLTAFIELNADPGDSQEEGTQSAGSALRPRKARARTGERSPLTLSKSA